MPDDTDTGAQAAADEAAKEAAAKEQADKDAADKAAAKAAEFGDDFDKERAAATILKQREEAKELRAKLKETDDLKAKLDALEAEKLTAQEKAEKRAEAAEAKVTAAEDRLRRANLIAELSKPEHGIVNAQAAAKLIDGVEYNADGEPSNLAAVLPDFLGQNTFLKNTGTGEKPNAGNLNAGGGQGQAKQPDLTAEQLEYAAKMGMTAAEYAAYLGKTSLTELQSAEKALAA